ncbi:hypothetical protein [Brevundimonas sp.]|uniref:hypothetical protein n=1 Tax=Brevundimonas sp. TaxID=1871086 RepID=UPI002ED7E62D
MTAAAIALEAAKIAVDLLKSFAWPAALIIVVLLLRKQITAILERIKAFRYGDAEMSFSDSLDKAKGQAAEAGITVARPLDAADRRAFEAADPQPRALVIETWAAVERELRTLSRAWDVTANSPAEMIRGLELAAGLPHGTRPVLDYLRDARNRAVHSDTEVTEGEALEFRMLGKSIIERLRNAPRPNT